MIVIKRSSLLALYQHDRCNEMKRLMLLYNFEDLVKSGSVILRLLKMYTIMLHY